MTLSELHKICDEATPGPWEEIENHDYYQGGTYIKAGKKEVCRIEGTEADKKYLLTFSPSRVKALLELLEDARNIMPYVSNLNLAIGWLEKYKKEMGE
jgi:hypothetical protein